MAKITKIRVKGTDGNFDEEYNIGSGTVVIAEKADKSNTYPAESGYDLPNNSIWLVVEEV